MSNKITLFAVGLVVSAVILIMMVLFFSRAGELPIPEDQEKIFSSADLNTIKKDTGGLQNFGELPFIISADQLGRENPFDSYK